MGKGLWWESNLDFGQERLLDEVAIEMWLKEEHETPRLWEKRLPGRGSLWGGGRDDQRPQKAWCLEAENAGHWCEMGQGKDKGLAEPDRELGLYLVGSHWSSEGGIGVMSLAFWDQTRCSTVWESEGLDVRKPVRKRIEVVQESHTSSSPPILVV